MLQLAEVSIPLASPCMLLGKIFLIRDLQLLNFWVLVKKSNLDLFWLCQYTEKAFIEYMIGKKKKKALIYKEL